MLVSQPRRLQKISAGDGRKSAGTVRSRRMEFCEKGFGGRSHQQAKTDFRRSRWKSVLSICGNKYTACKVGEAPTAEVKLWQVFAILSLRNLFNFLLITIQKNRVAVNIAIVWNNKNIQYHFVLNRAGICDFVILKLIPIQRFRKENSHL